MRRLLGLAFVAVVAWVALGLLVDPFEPTDHYASRSEAEAAGVFARGWFPEFLPATMRDICETHQIDANVVCATFAMDPASAADFSAGLVGRGFRKIASGGSPLDRCIRSDRCGFRRQGCDGFPVLLAGASIVDGDANYIAIDPGDGRVCYWTGTANLGAE